MKLEVPRFDPASLAVDNKVYVLGGGSFDRQSRRTVTLDSIEMGALRAPAEDF